MPRMGALQNLIDANNRMGREGLPADETSRESPSLSNPVDQKESNQAHQQIEITTESLGQLVSSD
jgi:hypothetical protein